jgi:dCTP deaminase
VSLLTFNSLEKLVKDGVITADPSHINAASIDVTLGYHFKVERPPESLSAAVNIRESTLNFYEVEVVPGSRLILQPGMFVLAETQEVFNLPDDIACEYKLKSSMARNGLQHLLAGWGDPGWHSSTMTLEFKNVTQNHPIELTPGMKIGQVVFWRGEKVPPHASYRTKGQYNNQSKAQGSKGIR